MTPPCLNCVSRARRASLGPSRLNRLPARAARQASRARRDGDDSSQIFFGGNEYSSGEWDDAMDRCALKAPPPSPRGGFQLNHISIRQLMRFDGPAPELINGRAAMLGFTAAALNEVVGNKGVIAQACTEPREIVVAFTLILVGSLFPLGQNIMPHDKEHGIFKAKAELWGGRVAMLGFFLLLSEEALRGGSPVF